MEPQATTPAFEEVLPNARYRELHHRVIDAPIDEVWPHCVEVTSGEIRLLGPLMSARGLPARLRGRQAPVPLGSKSLLDGFVEEGFIVVRQDTTPADGRASIIFGAAGIFWSMAHNSPIPFDSAADFIAFDTPGYAKTIARLDAIDLGDGTTRVETETLVHGTDPTSTKKFGPYWAIIRLGSGAIRRSWLKAIDRRVTKP